MLIRMSDKLHVDLKLLCTSPWVPLHVILVPFPQNAYMYHRSIDHHCTDLISIRLSKDHGLGALSLGTTASDMQYLMYRQSHVFTIALSW